MMDDYVSSHYNNQVDLAHDDYDAYQYEDRNENTGRRRAGEEDASVVASGIAGPPRSFAEL